MSQIRKRRTTLGLRGRLLGTMAVAAAWSVSFAGAAPSAIAMDVQSKQWYLEPMHAEEMWKTTTGEGIKVAVIDSGVNSSTPSLEGQVLTGLDATGTAGDEYDDYDGHGTTMAELIAGKGAGGGIEGLAPGAKIIPIRITNTDLQNNNSVNAYDTRDAIRFAADSDAQIISMSFSSEFSTQEEEEAVQYAQSKGKLLFAGVGNDAKRGNKKKYPASYPQVVGVAATDANGVASKYSQHGDNVDIAAPGDNIPLWCDKKFQSYCDSNGGTSQATAITSASAALIWSAHPEWTANQVLNVLFDTAGRGDMEKGTLSNFIGHGIIRPAVNILKGTGDPGAPDISPLTQEKTSGSAGSAAPSASASSQPAEKEKAEDSAMAGSSTEKNDDSQLGLILGGVAVVLVLGGGAFALARKRRTA